MKKIINYILYKLYFIKSTHFRTMIRKMISGIDGGQYYSKYLRRILKEYHNVEIGIGSYGSCFDPIKTSPNVKIGNYTSVASNVHFYTRNHGISEVSTHPLFFNKKLGNLMEDTKENSRLEIGNDVWIGQNVVILPSCNKIGNGVIIGAGAIVTKDIPDYAIVVGMPAIIKKYRFNKETIEKLNKIEWWNWKDKTIRERSEDFDNIDKFIGKYYKHENKKRTE